MSRKTRVALTRDVIDANGSFIAPGPGLSLLDGLPGVEYQLLPEHLPEITPEQIGTYDMVFSLTPKWTAASVRGNERLLGVHRFGVGYDMVDVAALTEAGVALYITPNAVRRPVASAILTFLLALSTKLFLKDRLIRDGRWSERAQHHGIGLVGKTLGSIGVGNIGKEVFRIAAPLEMRHIAHDPFVIAEGVSDVSVEMADMDTVVRESDFLSICCPLNERTYHLIGEPELRKMKPTSFLINMARGPVLDEPALVRSLQEGWIQGAGLDVFEKEPVAPDNPLLKMDNVILAPHSLAWLDQTFAGMWDEILAQMQDVINGTVAAGLVNPEVLENALYRSKLARFHEDMH